MIDVPKFLRSNVDEVAAKVIDGEAIIINLATGVYCSMAGSGADAWTWLESTGDVARTIDGLVAAYDVEPSRCRDDVERLVGELVAERLFLVASEPIAGGDVPAPPTLRQPYTPPALNVYRDMQELMALDPPMPASMQIPWDDLSRRRP